MKFKFGMDDLPRELGDHYERRWTSKSTIQKQKRADMADDLDIESPNEETEWGVSTEKRESKHGQVEADQKNLSPEDATDAND